MDYRRIVNQVVVGAAASAWVAPLVLSGAVHAGLYAHDDGASENAVGLTSGGEIAAIHAFSTHVGQEKVYLWSDDDGDGIPSNGGFTLLNTTIATVSAASIDTDVFQNVAIAPTAVPPSGCFIGYAVTHATGTFPLSQDQSQASLGRAWVGGDTGGSWDPATMGGDVALTEMDAAGLPGLWLLRATGVPSAPPCP